MNNINVDRKLDSFIESMVSEATDESRAITDELRSRETELIDKAEARINAEAEKYTRTRIAEIQAAENHRISTCMTDAQHRLLQYREECAAKVYAEIEERIAAFTASDEYLPHLQKLLRQALDAFGYGYSAEVILRPEDMKFADELITDATGVSLTATEGSFSLGGLCLNCPARGKRVDLTFDSALQDMKGHYSEYSGLKIDG